MTRSPVLAALLLAAPLLAQSASITPFGTGCAFNGQMLAIGATGLPQLGATFTIDYTGPNLNGPISTQPLLALGLQPTALPIPPALAPQQPGGCTQWVVPDALLAMPTSPSGGFVTQFSMTVPNNAALLGFTFNAQWAAFVIQCGIIPPCWFSALPTSDALAITVGL